MEMQKIQDFNSEIEQFLPQKADFFSFFPPKLFLTRNSSSENSSLPHEET